MTSAGTVRHRGGRNGRRIDTHRNFEHVFLLAEGLKVGICPSSGTDSQGIKYGRGEMPSGSFSYRQTDGAGGALPRFKYRLSGTKFLGSTPRWCLRRTATGQGFISCPLYMRISVIKIAFGSHFGSSELQTIRRCACCFKRRQKGRGKVIGKIYQLIAEF